MRGMQLSSTARTCGVARWRRPTTQWSRGCVGGRHHPRQDVDAGVRLDGRQQLAAPPASRTIRGSMVSTPAPRRRGPGSVRRRVTGRCIRAATARGRSACRRISAACLASSRPMAACRNRQSRRAISPCISGPLTRTVGDAARCSRTMAGPHRRSHQPGGAARRLSASPGRAAARTAPRRVRLDHARVDPEVAVLVRQAVEAFERDLG